ncbi:FAD-binding protein [Micromonospora sp. WMMD980]|uniref:FAD-binding protein n=1 Tax=Micromonospora sp. WMMD980 TaxID=3016088 RepID=UPI002415BE0C|nr:FAD-binding protein [Micromonospora sp. WMMD980]MDG4801041.1 FAD-binding protein [Micromonospora sp. WMMD980]
MTRAFVNWSGSLSFTPAEWAEPADEDEVCALVRRARDTGVTIRPVGSGHSSSPLVRTDGILLGLDRLAGVISDDGRLATAWAGTKLKALGEASTTPAWPWTTWATSTTSRSPGPPPPAPTGPGWASAT